MTGLTFENGPLQFHARAAVPNANPYSWTKLANVLYVDQPVGTGYSTGDKAPSNIANVTNDFFHWLEAFYDHFPTLRNKDTYIIGESYAGVYVSQFSSVICHTPTYQSSLSKVQGGRRRGEKPGRH